MPGNHKVRFCLTMIMKKWTRHFFAICSQVLALVLKCQVLLQRIAVGAGKLVEAVEVWELLRQSFDEHFCLWDPPGQDIFVAIDMLSYVYEVQVDSILGEGAHRAIAEIEESLAFFARPTTV